MTLKLKPAEDGSGDLMLELPEDVLRRAGLRPDDLVEIEAFHDTLDGKPIHSYIMIQKVKH